MFNITNHQGNETQNHNEICPHAYQNGYHKKKKSIAFCSKKKRNEKESSHKALKNYLSLFNVMDYETIWSFLGLESFYSLEEHGRRD